MIGIVALSSVPILLYLEFQFGFYQKFRFEQRAERYLEATYDEEMTIAGVRYLWDNVEPLVATAYPESDPTLRFYVHSNDERKFGLSDDYATTIWKRQAAQEAEALLAPIQPEYARRASVEFSCCEVGEYDYASIQGQVPHVGTTGIPFDLVVDAERPMGEADAEAMFRSVSALRTSETLVLKSLAFRFPLPVVEGAAVSFEIPGDALGALASAEELEAYHATRLPARVIADWIGASLGWDATSNEATFTLDGTTLVVRSWEKEALLDGAPIEDPVGAFLGGETSQELMVSVRLVERAFGRKLELW